MRKNIIKAISDITNRLESERLPWFSKSYYRDYFIESDQGYELAADKWFQLKLTCFSAEEGMTNIKNLLDEYHQLPFWKQWWWFITRPMTLYQHRYLD